MNEKGGGVVRMNEMEGGEYEKGVCVFLTEGGDWDTGIRDMEKKNGESERGGWEGFFLVRDLKDGMADW